MCLPINIKQDLEAICKVVIFSDFKIMWMMNWRRNASTRSMYLYTNVTNDCYKLLGSSK